MAPQAWTVLTLMLSWVRMPDVSLEALLVST